MNQFKMYIGPGGDVKAVKCGWNWAGFFFTYFWAGISKLWSLGVFSFMLHLVLIAVLLFAENNIEQVFHLTAAIWMVVKFVFGFKGNELVEKSLCDLGYEFKETMTCVNAEYAVYYFKNKMLQPGDAGSL